ncbi:hypothetical protein N665_4633s0001 [Sinapis alba]|nr:hypothetical protein N665_4633s0001 [Sinapis alba]
MSPSEQLRDRLRQWGSNVPASCLLCDSLDETRDHLFFECTYSQEVWSPLFMHATFNPPVGFDAIIHWLPSSFSIIKIRTICNLLVQAITYVLWKERNSRLHTSSSRPSLLLVKEVKRLIKAKLIGLDRVALPTLTQFSHQSTSTPETFLHLWFRFFDD